MPDWRTRRHSVQPTCRRACISSAHGVPIDPGKTRGRREAARARAGPLGLASLAVFAGAGLTTDAIPAGSDLDLMLSCTRRAHAVAMPGASVRRSGQTAWCGMHFYLPVAEMSANVFIFLAMGGAVGFLSGLFGVGGGFLMTPLLIFSGIPSPVAVASVTGQVAAASTSGALSYYRRGGIDLHLAMYLILASTIGAMMG